MLFAERCMYVQAELFIYWRACVQLTYDAYVAGVGGVRVVVAGDGDERD